MLRCTACDNRGTSVLACAVPSVNVPWRSCSLCGIWAHKWATWRSPVNSGASDKALSVCQQSAKPRVSAIHTLGRSSVKPIGIGLPWWLSGKEFCLPMQETQVWSLIWEDPTCCRAPKPRHNNYWACALEPGSCNYWAWAPLLLKPEYPRAYALQPEKPPQWEAQALQPESSPCSPQLEKSPHSSKNPAQPKIKH